MTSRAVLALVAMSVLGACMDAQDANITGRADNDMLRFSASNYILALEDES